MASTPFTQRARSADVAAAADGVLDVLVVGLGATGAGVALDAASRGLRVAAVERGDVASGTSSKSSKLIHGGLRYLENYEFGLVLEGVSERQLLMRLAPHLVRAMDFIYPVWPNTARRRLLGLGMTTYDVFAGMRNVRRHDRISGAEAVARAPALARSGPAYAYVYGDSATDDARLVLAVVGAARAHGAVALTYSEVADLRTDPDGRVNGAVVRDRLTGADYELRARHVVNATGVWADRLRTMADPAHPTILAPSKGVHLVVPHERLPLEDAAVVLPSRQGDARSMFAIPWGRQTILGTTDTAYDGDLDEMGVTAADLDYILAAGNAVFHRGLDATDVVGAWAGVRPLLRAADGSGTMSDVSRKHLVFDDPNGLLTVTGGKLTTYRRMAKDVVDRIVARDERKARCVTERISLGLHHPLPAFTGEVVVAADRLGLGAATAKLLVRQHGDAALDVLGLVERDASLAEPLSAAADHIAAEVVWAARAEGAACLDDVYSRRMRLSLRDRGAALNSAGRAARLLAAELGHDEAWARAQVAAYADGVRVERGVLGLPELAERSA